MGIREIKRAAEKKGISVIEYSYGWTATPEENVTNWEIEFSENIEEIYGADSFQFFDSSKKAIEWINDLQEVTTQ